MLSSGIPLLVNVAVPVLHRVPLYLCTIVRYPYEGGFSGVVVKFLPPTSEAAGSNLRPGTSCWKVGSYLPMPGGLQCSMHWFPPPVNYPSQYDLSC